MMWEFLSRLMGDPKKHRSLKLIVSLIIDLIGYVSYLVPFWGEISDILFFLVEAGWIYYAYGSKKLAIFGGLEELLPFTDFLPASTIAHWMTRK
jgi:hypothetical protein